MVDYILEAGKTTLCSIDEPYNGCGEKEKGYIVKMSAAAPAEIATKVARLEGMKGKSMKPELKVGHGRGIHRACSVLVCM